jgi:hypothetical protein
VVVLPLVKPSLKRLADAVVASMRLRIHALGRFDPLRISEDRTGASSGSPLRISSLLVMASASMMARTIATFSSATSAGYLRARTHAGEILRN